MPKMSQKRMYGRLSEFCSLNSVIR